MSSKMIADLSQKWCIRSSKEERLEPFNHHRINYDCHEHHLCRQHGLLHCCDYLFSHADVKGQVTSAPPSPSLWWWRGQKDSSQIDLKFYRGLTKRCTQQPVHTLVRHLWFMVDLLSVGSHSHRLWVSLRR